MITKNFTVNNENRSGLLFVSSTGADVFTVWNKKTNVALVSNAKVNPCGISTTQLKQSTLKNVKSTLNQLLNRGYSIFTTPDGLQNSRYVELDKNNFNKVLNELVK